MFAGSVGIDRLDTCSFWNRHLIRGAVEGGAATKNKGVAVVLVHRAEESLRPNNVHIPVPQGLLYRFAYSLEASEMNHSFDWLPKRFGASEQRIETVPISNVALHESECLRCCSQGRLISLQAGTREFSDPYQGNR